MERNSGIRLRTLAVAAFTLGGLLFTTSTAHAETTINCVYTGPIVDNPGMQYVCYVRHDDGSREIFYAPGPAINP